MTEEDRREGLAGACPGCDDAAVYELEFEEEIYWAARGWCDPHTKTDTAISYCPLCGFSLDTESVDTSRRN